MLKANVAKLLRLAQLAPYGLDTNKERLLNVRSARTLIELCHELKIEPRQLIDAGANNSQWAYWLIIVVEMWNHYPGLPQWKYQQADIWRLMLKHGKSECRVIDADLTMDGVPFYDAAFFSPR